VPNLKFDASKVFDDTKEMPAYSIPLAAHYLRVPVSTLVYWVRGYRNKTKRSHSDIRPVLTLPDNAAHLLSFYNLAEAHVLRVFRTRHSIKLSKIRAAIDYLGDRFNTSHPLISHQFKTDGVRLFIEHLGSLLDATTGQMVMGELMMHLERLEFEHNAVARLYPFTRSTDDPDSPRSIFIDPRYSFGRPVLSSIYVPSGIIADRYKAGDSVGDLVTDYECSTLDIEEAIRCELSLGQAA
jgi:uncharacterized protein (DUF433 family)